MERHLLALQVRLRRRNDHAAHGVGSGTDQVVRLLEAGSVESEARAEGCRGGDGMKDLAQLKESNIERLDWTDILNASDDLPAEDRDAMAEYFKHFAKPKGVCIKCGARLGGLLGSFRWGIQHGEGECSQCGYPARGYHRDVGPIEFLPMVLQYHPNELEEPKAVPSC